MCELCGTVIERRKERDRLVSVGKKIEKLGRDYLALAYGKIDPHSEESKKIQRSAVVIIKHLVSEWL